MPHAPLRRPPRRAAWQRGLVARRGARRDGKPRTTQDRLPILTGGTGLYFAALTQGLADIPDPGAEGPRRGPRAARPNSAPRRCMPGSPPSRPRHRRAPEPQRQPAHRPRLGGVARHRQRPRRLAGAARHARAVAVHRHPARSAARGAARRHRHPLRRHARQRRAGRGARPAGAGPGPRAAGDARARRAGAVRPFARRDQPGTRPAAAPNWSPANTPSARRRGSATMLWPSPHAYDPCAIMQVSTQFSERNLD